MSTLVLSTSQRVANFTHALVVALVNLELYSSQSQHLKDNLHDLHVELAGLFASGCVDPLDIHIQGGTLLHEGHVILSSTLQGGKLLRLCKERRIQRLRFSSHAESREILGLLQLLSTPEKGADSTDNDFYRQLSQHGIRNIAVGLQQEATPALSSSSTSIDPAIPQYQALADCLHDSHVAAHRGQELAMDRATGLVETTLGFMEKEPSGLLALANYDDIDSFTVGHSVRVALLTMQVAQAAGANRPQLVQVGTAALLHDIGKSKIPQEILFKRGPLDTEEREIMARHARLGGEVLLQQTQLDPTAIGAAFCHHMTPHGGGYPSPAIPFEPSGISKLVRVCDVFEALTSVRPYKQALNPLAAYTVMFRQEDSFDPKWLRFFVQTLGIYPQGTRLNLHSGATAVVTAKGQQLDRPTVRTLTNAQGQTLALAEQEEFVLEHGACQPPAPEEDSDLHGPTSCCGKDLLEGHDKEKE